MVRAVTAMPEVGKEYNGKVVRTTTFGAFVEILPGQDGLVHISQMGDGYVRKVEDIMQVGDEVTVSVLTIDDQGRVDLALAGASAELKPTESSPADGDRNTPRDRDRGRSGPRDSRNDRSGRSENSRDSRSRRSPRIPKGRL